MNDIATASMLLGTMMFFAAWMVCYWVHHLARTVDDRLTVINHTLQDANGLRKAMIERVERVAEDELDGIDDDGAWELREDGFEE